MWQQINDNSLLKAGNRYRVRWLVSSPYPPGFIQDSIRTAIKLYDRTRADIEITDVKFYSPSQTVYVSRNPLWSMEVYFTDHDQVPILVAIGVIMAAIGAIILGWSIVNRSAEMFVKEVDSTLKDTVFSPGFVIAGLVVGILALTR